MTDAVPSRTPSRPTLGPAAVLLAMSFAAASAQDIAPAGDGRDVAAPGADSLADIVVTAERRATNLQQTPVAVTAIGEEQIQEQGLSVIRDLAGQAPNVQVPRGSLTPTTQVFFIRGIGTSDPIQDPAVGVYVDDVYIPRPISDGGQFQLPDLDRVEVLRGPQGTLYGRNSSAGAIRLVTRDLDGIAHASVDAGVGDHGELQTHALLSGPVINGLAYASLSFAREQRDGTTYDPTIHRDVNDIDLYSGRAKVRLTPSDGTDILLAVDGMLDRSTPAYYTPFRQPGGGFNPSETFSPLTPLDDLRSGGVSARATQRLDNHLTGKAIFSARAWDQGPVIYDNAGTAGLGAANLIRYHQKDYTAELQLAGAYDRVARGSDGVDFVAGLYYFDETFKVFRSTVANYVGVLNTQNRTVTDSYAAYGQAAYKLVGDLSLTFGARYTVDHRDFADANHRLRRDPALPVFDQFIPSELLFQTGSNASWSSFTPKAGLQYAVTPGIFAYVSYAEGFKGGGYDNRAANLAIAQKPFAPETVDTYEAGLKSDLLERRLRANVAVFYNDYQNFQASKYITPILTELVNAARAHTQGVELETTAIPLAGLEWSNSVGYLDAEFDDFPNAGAAGQNARGRRLPQAPRWSYTSSASYALPLDIPGAIRVGGDVEFTTKAYSDVLDTQLAAIPQQTFVNFHVSYFSEDGRWSGTVALRNALNDRFNQSGTYTGAIGYYFENPPRTVLATARCQF